MAKYLIIHGGAYQTVAELESIEELLFKYPEDVTAVIKIDDDVIKDIQDGNFLHAGDNM